MSKRSKWILSILLLAFIAGCGGTTSPGGDGEDPGDPDPGPGDVPVVSEISLRAETSNLPSAANTRDEGILVSATPTDAGGNVIDGATISFSASDDGLLVEPQASATPPIPSKVLTTDNPKNRTITVTATSGSASASLDIQVVGTGLSIDGPTTATVGNTISYTATLVNSADEGIQGKRVNINSPTGDAATPDTDASGKATYAFTPASPGSKTLTFSALDGTVIDTITVNVTDAVFQFVSPAPGTQVPLNTAQSLKIEWKDQSGNVVTGSTVDFSTTRGTLTPASDTTDGTGQASTSITSNNPGSTTVTATTNTGLSTSVELTFIATSAAQIQANALPVSVGPGENSTITASVRNAAGYLVTGAKVQFKINGSGTIDPPSGTTGTNGLASTTYTAGPSAATQPVKITAKVDGTALEDTVEVTINEQPLSLILGTSNEIQEDGTFYLLPYSVLVTDSEGNPVQGASVELSLNPAPAPDWAYREGVKAKVDTDGDGTPDIWAVQATATCLREDSDQNGDIGSGEDRDGDGQLEPASPGTVPSSVVTLDNGSATFNIRYFKDRSGWVQARLSASTNVAGSQGQSSATFVLPVLAADVQPDVPSPPGQTSPYGTNGDCTSPG